MEIRRENKEHIHTEKACGSPRKSVLKNCICKNSIEKEEQGLE